MNLLNQGKRVGVWIRVSTEDQAAGESPEHHEFRAKKYAEFNGWTVLETYDLAGVSGKSVWEHPECQRMLRDVKRGHIQGLIFSKLARLARNTKELLDFAQHFETHKSALVSIEEKIDTSTPAGLLFYTMLGAIAQWEREEINARLKSSIAVRAKLGKPLSGMSPYGFKWVDKKLQLVPAEAAIRRQTFELFLEHKRKGVVARILNERGSRTRSGKKWRDVQIARILDCTSAIGEYRINRYKRTETSSKAAKPPSEWGTVPCPAIISRDVFERVNRLLEEQHKPSRKPGKKPAQVFTGILKCGCGHKMYVYTRSPNYTCNKCKNKIGIASLDEIFVGAVADSLADGGKIAAHLRKARLAIADKQQQAVLAKEQITALKSEIRKVYDLYISGAVTVEQFKEVNLPLNERLIQLTEELPRLEGEIAALEVSDLSAEVIASEAKGLAALWPTLDIEGKQRLAAALCTEIMVPNKDADAPIEITFSHTPPPSQPSSPADEASASNSLNTLHHLAGALFVCGGIKSKAIFQGAFSRSWMLLMNSASTV